jgi:hypothetical protein
MAISSTVAALEKPSFVGESLGYSLVGKSDGQSPGWTSNLLAVQAVSCEPFCVRFATCYGEKKQSWPLAATQIVIKPAFAGFFTALRSKHQCFLTGDNTSGTGAEQARTGERPPEGRKRRSLS